MIDQLRKAAEMALDYIKDIRDHCACEGIDCDKEDGLIEALRQALAHDEQEPVWCGCGDGIVANDEAKCGVCVMRLENQIERLKAQPEQEPVAWMYVNEDGECEQIEYGVSTVEAPYITLLYTAPPSKPWVDLSDEEKTNIASTKNKSRHWLVWATEASLRSKNT